MERTCLIVCSSSSFKHVLQQYHINSTLIFPQFDTGLSTKQPLSQTFLGLYWNCFLEQPPKGPVNTFNTQINDLFYQKNNFCQNNITLMKKSDQKLPRLLYCCVNLILRQDQFGIIGLRSKTSLPSCLIVSPTSLFIIILGTYYINSSLIFLTCQDVSYVKLQVPIFFLRTILP